MPATSSQTGVVYYAHPMCMYGRRIERAQLEAIERGFPGSHIINPADYDNHPDKRRAVLNFCLRLIEEEADRVVFTKALDQITCGVGEEVNHALSLGLEVVELAREKGEWVFRPQHKPVEYISRGETLRLYRRFRERYS
jgi:hypothetical protein